MRRIHSERPTDRPELTNVKEARPRQPGDMIRVTHARIKVGTEITNRGGWLNRNPTDDDTLVRYLWLGTSRRLQHCDGLNMTVCGADVRPVDCVRDLGVLIDSNMTLSNHVNNVAGICFYQLRQLRIIRRSLTTDAAHSLVRALIHTRVDYCNGLLAAGP